METWIVQPSKIGCEVEGRERLWAAGDQRRASSHERWNSGHRRVELAAEGRRDC